MIKKAIAIVVMEYGLNFKESKFEIESKVKWASVIRNEYDLSMEFNFIE